METLGSCAESEASKPVRADGLLSSWRNTQMVRPDISWSVNAYWHSIIQKNCRERLKKISTDGRAALASRATSAGTRRLWGKKLLLVHLGGGGELTWCFLLRRFRLFKVRLLRGTRASQWLLFWPWLQGAALHAWAKTSVISGLACFFCLTSSKSCDPTSSPELSDHKTMGF